jgi:DNA-binding response OmpR family regulator
MGVVTKSVLLVEDDQDIRLVIRTFLEEEGFSVVEAPTAGAAIEAAHAAEPDLALVDLRLPDRHGFEVVRELRGFSSVPIVIVTAQADSHDVVAGLEAGADDYVTKPFVMKELLARIRAQLRRGSVASEGASRITAGPFEVDPERVEARKDGQLLPLSRTEFQVLAAMVANRGRTLARDKLLRDVWGYAYAGDGRVVDNLVYRLRLKVEDDAADPKHIKTVRGFGYRFEA